MWRWVRSVSRPPWFQISGRCIITSLVVSGISAVKDYYVWDALVFLELQTSGKEQTQTGVLCWVIVRLSHVLTHPPFCQSVRKEISASFLCKDRSRYCLNKICRCIKSTWSCWEHYCLCVQNVYWIGKRPLSKPLYSRWRVLECELVPTTLLEVCVSQESNALFTNHTLDSVEASVCDVKSVLKEQAPDVHSRL